MKNILIFLISIFSTSSLFGVTQYRKETIPFIQNSTLIRTSINIPTNDEIENVRIPVKKLRKRILKSEQDISVEPINLWVKKDARTISDFASQIARNGKSLSLHAELLKRVEHQKENKNGNVKFTPDKKRFRLRKSL